MKYKALFIILITFSTTVLLTLFLSNKAVKSSTNNLSVLEAIYVPKSVEETYNEYKAIYTPFKKVHREKFIARWAAIAYNEMLYARENGFYLYPSIKLAQGAIESNWGRSSLTTKYNNYFGIKLRKGHKGVTMNTYEYSKKLGYYNTKSKFTHYKSAWECWRDHTVLLMSKKHYNKALSSKYDYKKQIKIISRKYATDKDYHKKVVHFINKYNLHLLDKMNPIEASHVISLIRISVGYSPVMYSYEKNRIVIIKNSDVK